MSSFGQIAQWLECVHGKHEVVDSNSTWTNFLCGIEKPLLKMNTIYILCPKQGILDQQQ